MNVGAETLVQDSAAGQPRLPFVAEPASSVSRSTAFTPVGPVPRLVDRVARLPEAAPEQHRHPRLVLDDQDSHARLYEGMRVSGV